MQCKKCGSEHHVKAGFISGEQRCLCKDCGCKFVPTRHHGKPKKDKLLAVWLYMHGLSFRTIPKLYKVSPKAIFDWVKAFAKENGSTIVMLEENSMFEKVKNVVKNIADIIP